MAVKYVMIYCLHTLVDITNTGVWRKETGNEKLRDQQQNFNTVLQTIGLRANIEYRRRPEVEKAPADQFGFKDSVNVWTFEWYCDREAVWTAGAVPLGLLKQDFDLIPFIPNLDESMVMRPSVFRSTGTDTNIVFTVRE